MDKPLLDLTNFALKKTQDAMHVEDRPREETEVHAQGKQVKPTQMYKPLIVFSQNSLQLSYPATASMQGPASLQLPAQ